MYWCKVISWRISLLCLKIPAQREARCETYVLEQVEEEEEVFRFAWLGILQSQPIISMVDGI